MARPGWLSVYSVLWRWCVWVGSCWLCDDVEVLEGTGRHDQSNKRRRRVRRHPETRHDD